jgi:hypothetical protein
MQDSSKAAPGGESRQKGGRKMQDWINVFVNDRYYGGMWAKDLPAIRADFRASAVRLQRARGADHVVYCHIEYNGDGEIQAVNMYHGLEMDDKTFYERTAHIKGTDYVGAVHKHGGGNTACPLPFCSMTQCGYKT